MAPEFPPVLVIFNSRFEDGSLTGSIEYVESPNPKQRLRVRWSVASLPEGYREVGGGVAYVYDKGIEILPISEDASPNYLGEHYGHPRYRWTEGMQFGVPWLMFILILPKDYSLAVPMPALAGTKIYDSRIAAYWILKGDDVGRTQVECSIKPLQQDLHSEIVEINQLCMQKAPRNIPISVDEEIIHMYKMLEVLNKRRRVIELQVAQLGSTCPAPIKIELDEITEQIRDLEQKLPEQ